MTHVCYKLYATHTYMYMDMSCNRVAPVSISHVHVGNGREIRGHTFRYMYYEKKEGRNKQAMSNKQ